MKYLAFSICFCAALAFAAFLVDRGYGEGLAMIVVTVVMLLFMAGANQ